MPPTIMWAELGGMKGDAVVFDNLNELKVARKVIRQSFDYLNESQGGQEVFVNIGGQ